MRYMLALLLVMVFCVPLFAADAPGKLKIHPPKVNPERRQEYLVVRPSLLIDIGTPVDSLLTYRAPKEREAIAYEHYRWMLYSPSDYKVTGTPRPQRADIFNVTAPLH